MTSLNGSNLALLVTVVMFTLLSSGCSEPRQSTVKKERKAKIDAIIQTLENYKIPDGTIPDSFRCLLGTWETSRVPYARDDESSLLSTLRRKTEGTLYLTDKLATGSCFKGSYRTNQKEFQIIWKPVYLIPQAGIHSTNGVNQSPMPLDYRLDAMLDNVARTPGIMIALPYFSMTSTVGDFYFSMSQGEEQLILSQVRYPNKNVDFSLRISQISGSYCRTNGEGSWISSSHDRGSVRVK